MRSSQSINHAKKSQRLSNLFAELSVNLSALCVKPTKEQKYGRNFTEKNLRRMMQFCIEFPDFQIVVPLARQLSWSHFLLLIPLKSIESKLYYAQNAIENNWGKRELKNQIERKAFERNEIANIQLTSHNLALIFPPFA